MYQVINQQPRMPSSIKLDVVTAPAIEPVTYAEIVDFLRLPSLTDKDVVNNLISVGREYVEARTRQTLITTTFDYWLDEFPAAILIPARPLQSVTYVKYYDQTGTLTTLSASNYLVDNKGQAPLIVPPLGTFFPYPKFQYPNAVNVRFVAGYGDTAADVPESCKQAIKQWVALNYDQREAVVLGKTPARVPHGFDDLLNLNKIWEF